MVGRAEAPQGAPVSSKAGKTNSVRFHHQKIGLFGGGSNNHLLEAALWLRSQPTLTRYLPFLSTPQQISSRWPTTANASPKP
ncbi:ash family protein [Pectobacterium polaris]|uniref:Ash family protein n=1 Tax=Pectobacterium polaris TaxID=2042057 RepID=A0AAW4NVT8_9GAMM|nr:ash family protein [Pectobacterium polaris]MBW5891230.1 ash family protein [Pectobacterium polaris]